MTRDVGGRAIPSIGAAEKRQAVRAAVRLARHVESALADAGLTFAQYRLLIYLTRAPAFPSDIAAALDVRPPSFTQMADGLVAAGLVERAPSESDRRRVSYVLTRAGRKALAAAEQAVVRRLDNIGCDLEPTERARAYEGLALWFVALDRSASRRIVAP